mmetsp:Transcript_13346/g.29880  ORF Transcript_13346/g.29880 Transcript_13346/m.29880 type:complete len:269 (-) Transcript_13346:222-1028(-)
MRRLEAPRFERQRHAPRLERHRAGDRLIPRLHGSGVDGVGHGGPLGGSAHVCGDAGAQIGPLGHEVLLEEGGGFQAGKRVLLQHMHQHASGRSVQVVHRLVVALIIKHNCLHELGVVLPLERVLGEQHEVQSDPQGPDIRLNPVVQALPEHLRRTVMKRTAGALQPFVPCVQAPGEPEINDLQGAAGQVQGSLPRPEVHLVRKQKVLWLEVPVDHHLPPPRVVMQKNQALQGLLNNFSRIPHGKSSTAGHHPEGVLPGTEGHHNKQHL